MRFMQRVLTTLWPSLAVMVSAGTLSTAAFSAAPAVAAESGETTALIATLRKVDREGKGHRAATQAWAQLTANSTAEQLPTILAGIDGAGPLAANWLRAAVDAIAERHLRQHGELPISDLEAFVKEQRHDPRARRLAFEWIAMKDPGAPDRIIPQMLDDPSLELRRDAVARVITAAQAAQKEEKKDAALADYRKALAAARDLDQVKVVTDALKTLGHPVDLPSHYGFVQDWQLVGPFDNVGGKGFNVAYPPEEKIDLKARYTTPAGELTWKAHHTTDEYGQVDLNAELGKHKGVVAYAVSEFNSPQAQVAQLRLGTEAANKIWLNGKLLHSADVYHANGTMDQYTGQGELKAGRNVIVLKICQNEQKEDWAQDWKFQLRVCDPLGAAILSTDRPAPKPAGEQTAANTNKE